jgi:RHS repeat-associated protein
VLTNEETTYILPDHLGSVHTLTSETGTFLHAKDFGPFGEDRSPDPEGRVRYGFTGHEDDLETGLVNMRGRLYDPKLGAFIQVDPMLDPGPAYLQGLNRYSYVYNSPLNATDPSGFLGENESGEHISGGSSGAPPPTPLPPPPPPNIPPGFNPSTVKSYQFGPGGWTINPAPKAKPTGQSGSGSATPTASAQASPTSGGHQIGTGPRTQGNPGTGTIGSGTSRGPTGAGPSSMGLPPTTPQSQRGFGGGTPPPPGGTNTSNRGGGGGPGAGATGAGSGSGPASPLQSELIAAAFANGESPDGIRTDGTGSPMGIPGGKCDSCSGGKLWQALYLAATAGQILTGAFVGVVVGKLVKQAARGAKAIDPNRLNHIFGKAEHALDDFVRASGGREQAFTRIQEAASVALREGKLVPGPGGILPSGNAGPIIDVGGTQIRLIGGRVVDGVVDIASASRRGLP